MQLHPIFQLNERAISGSSDENIKNKSTYHEEGKKLLRELALRLGMPTAHIRSNVGGFSVPGEVVLHADQLYIQLHMSFGDGGARLLYRTCNGRQDYTGGTNHYFPVAKLADEDQVDLFVYRCKDLISSKAVA